MQVIIDSDSHHTLKPFKMEQNDEKYHIRYKQKVTLMQNVLLGFKSFLLSHAPMFFEGKCSKKYLKHMKSGQVVFLLSFFDVAHIG